MRQLCDCGPHLLTPPEGLPRYLHAVVESPRLSLATVVLDCPDAHVLADFYGRLLGWEAKWTEPDWVLLENPAGGTRLSFQSEAGYEPPVWPEQPGEQQKMLHLDIRCDDLEEAGAHAIAAGATLADHQPQEDVRVFLDPAGHPFCLFIN
jgi:catechol 2,3-dioxygenase-like lactoylglutathione lyase family enzyme